MAILDRSERPKTELENILWAIKKSDIIYDIELARIIAENHGVLKERLDVLLGPQMIIIDPTFLKERNLLSKPRGIVKSIMLYFNRRVFTSVGMKRLLKFTGNDLILKK